MIIVLSYFNPLVSGNNIASVDGIVIDYIVSNADVRQKLLNKLSALPILRAVEVIHWEGHKPGSFRDQFSIRLASGVSFWIGVSLNGSTVSWGRCRLEANPNKVGCEPVFIEMLGYLNEITRPVTRHVARFDLAIDIPVPRENCFLVKDRRLYIERRHGAEYTQYLGAKSSKVGRVKLYNKQIESDLDDPLTRLELTLDPKMAFEEINMPTVFCVEQSDLDLTGLKLSDTDRFVLRVILQGHGSLAELGRKAKKKMATLVNQCAKKVEISETDYNAILQQLQGYVNGSKIAASERPTFIH